MNVNESLWSVKLPNGDVRTGTFEQLDEAFRAHYLTESVLVRAAGGATWVKLGELMGSEPAHAPMPAQLAVARQSPARVAAAFVAPTVPSAAAPAPVGQPRPSAPPPPAAAQPQERGSAGDWQVKLPNGEVRSGTRQPLRPRPTLSSPSPLQLRPRIQHPCRPRVIAKSGRWSSRVRSSNWPSATEPSMKMRWCSPPEPANGFGSARSSGSEFNRRTPQQPRWIRLAQPTRRPPPCPPLRRTPWLRHLRRARRLPRWCPRRRQRYPNNRSKTTNPPVAISARLEAKRSSKHS
jgi:hypothetical protein